MLSLLHLKGRNDTCTEIELSKIIRSQLPIPHSPCETWFQGNGSHLQRLVRRQNTINDDVFSQISVSAASFKIQAMHELVIEPNFWGMGGASFKYC